MIERIQSRVERTQLNFEAWWRFHGYEAFAPLNDGFTFYADDTNRICYPLDPRIERAVLGLEAEGIFKKEKIKPRNHGPMAIHSWREQEEPSVQAIRQKFMWEFDADLRLWTRDVRSFLLHMTRDQIIDTDPFKVAEGFRKRGILT